MCWFCKKGTKYLEEKDYKMQRWNSGCGRQKEESGRGFIADSDSATGNRKKYEKAEKALEKALKNGTEETATLYNILGICDLELDKPEKAVYYFENGQELSGAGKSC